jgi:hypothetical protein
MFIHPYFYQKETELTNARLEKISRHAWKGNFFKEKKSRKLLKNIFHLNQWLHPILNRTVPVLNALAKTAI